MGQRGHKAAFMPGKFVFPGGAVDAEDFQANLQGNMSPKCMTRLSQHLFDAERGAGLPHALGVAALRELREETGLEMPSVTGLSFVFRAITPPASPRRFDARFFIADAGAISSDLDDFSRAEDELSYLQWVSLDETRDFNLPFVTQVVLREVGAILDKPMPPDRVPFYDHRSEIGSIRSLR